ncbi:MAG: hypothetical protein U0231_04580 [Nitrospiraceae bacterium]
MTIPDGTTIVGPDGTPQTELTVTQLSPDRVPPLPEDTAPRSVYLFSFEKPGGGTTPSKPVPIIYPNDLGAPPVNRIDLWYYSKTDRPDAGHSHQWKKYGQGTVRSRWQGDRAGPRCGATEVLCELSHLANFTIRTWDS